MALRWSRVSAVFDFWRRQSSLSTKGMTFLEDAVDPLLPLGVPSMGFDGLLQRHLEGIQAMAGRLVCSQQTIDLQVRRRVLDGRYSRFLPESNREVTGRGKRQAARAPRNQFD